ncbi:MAG: hypothetical protein L0G59_08730, partial [Kocuria sp.]|nr:hypothetical protein [Kocuria sp.]
SRMAKAQSPAEACAAFYEQVRGRELDTREREEIISAVAEAERLRAAGDMDSPSGEEGQA